MLPIIFEFSRIFDQPVHEILVLIAYGENEGSDDSLLHNHAVWPEPLLLACI